MSNSQEMMAALEQQDLEQAMHYFEKALEEDDEETLLELGAYLEWIGFLPQAKEIYDRLVTSYPELAINLAEIAAEDGEIEDAFLYLDRIEPDDETYVSALLVMADLYQMEGLADVAREKLLLAYESSQDAPVILGLAEIDMELGYYKEAIAYYAKLDYQAMIDQAGISIYQRIGLAYASLGQFEAAIEFLEKAVELSYDDQTVFELATLLLDQKETQKAVLYFKQLDSMNPDFEGYEYAYAKALHEEHQTTEALRVAQQGLAKNSFDSALLLLASQLSYETHDSQAAERYLLEARRVTDDEEEVLLRLSNLYLEQEDYERVVDLADGDIDNVLTKWNIAKAYEALEMDEALEAYEAIADDLKANPEFLKDYAYLLLRYGQGEKARAVAQAYLKLVPDDLDVATDFEE